MSETEARVRSSDAGSLPGWTTWTRSSWSSWFSQGGPKGSREWSSWVMRRGLGLRHTWLCRDTNGVSSLPDEVGSSPHERKEDSGLTFRTNLLLALRLGPKMSRNTRTVTLYK